MLYRDMAELYEKLELKASKLGKADILAEFLAKADPKELPDIVLMAMGKVFPSWSEKEVGVAEKIMVKGIAQAYGATSEEVTSRWKSIGDLGSVAEAFAGKKRQATLFSKKLTLELVKGNLRKMAELEGTGSQDRKLSMISELLSMASPKEAKYVTRSVLEDLRVGVAEGNARDAIAKAFFTEVLWKELLWQKSEAGKEKGAKGGEKAQKGVKRYEKILSEESGKRVIIDEEIRKKIEEDCDCPEVLKKLKSAKAVNAKEIGEMASKTLWKKKTGADYFFVSDAEMGGRIRKGLSELLDKAYSVSNDMGEVASIACAKGEAGLSVMGISPLRPVKAMLFQKVSDVEEAFDTVGRPAAWEPKFDGLRVQLHGKNGQVKLFTRRLDEVTKQFPDVVSAVKKAVKSSEFILDSEVVGLNVKTGKFRPFQEMSRRIRRKYGVSETAETVPAVVMVFDAMMVDGKNLLPCPFSERRSEIERVVKQIPGEILLAEQLVTGDEEKAEKLYRKSLAEGNEGAMAKNLSAPYKPGSRVGYGVKLKPIMETLDLVIVGAEWGTGKRAKWLSSFVLGCRDETGSIVEIGKMGTGIKEKAEEGTSFDELTEALRPLITGESGREVRIRPKIVVEVAYEEVQKSPSYSSGFALRFPRMIRLRPDKGIDDADDITRITSLYEKQRGRG